MKMFVRGGECGQFQDHKYPAGVGECGLDVGECGRSPSNNNESSFKGVGG